VQDSSGDSCEAEQVAACAIQYNLKTSQQDICRYPKAEFEGSFKWHDKGFCSP
jgi:hypothetical protein